MLTEEEFEQWCRCRNLSDAAKARIHHIRSSPPARNVESRIGNVTGAYPSTKMGVTIQFESHTCEWPAILLLESDPEVLEYYNQPAEPLTLSYRSAKGRAVGCRHTADFFVIKKFGAGWHEWKFEERLIQLSQESPNRYVATDTHGWRCPPGEAYAAEFGLFYELHSTTELNAVLHRNLMFLEDYVVQPLVVNPDLILNVTEVVKREPGILLSDLLAETKATPDDLFSLIATGCIYVDLKGAPLSKQGYVRVFGDVLTCEAFSVAERNALTMPSPPIIDLALGKTLIWDMKTWTILNVGEHQVSLLNKSRDMVHLPTRHIEQMVREGRLVGATVNSSPSLSEQAQARVNAASEQDLEMALQRQKIVDACRLVKSWTAQGGVEPTNHEDVKRLRDAQAVLAETPPRTCREYVRLYREGEATFGSGFANLIPQTSKRGNRQSRISKEHQDLIVAVIKEHLLNHTLLKFSKAYGPYKVECEKKGFAHVSLKTFLAVINRIPKQEMAEAREGMRVAYQVAGPIGRQDWDVPSCGERPWDVAHIDHSEAPVELVCSQTGQNLGRPWISYMYDAFSDRILALVLLFSPPSYRTLMLLLRVVVQRFGRLPENLVVDRGPEFGSTDFRTFCGLYRVRVTDRPASQPRHGHSIERFFGISQDEFMYALQGNTQIMKNVRQVTQSVNPKTLAIWTLGDLYVRTSRYVYEIYDTSTRSRLGCSPQQAYQDGMHQHGQRPQRLIPYDECFKILSLPTVKRGTVMVRPGKGFRYHYLDYWSDIFRDPKIERRSFKAKEDPFDCGHAYIKIGNQWIEAMSSHYTVFRGRTAAERDMAAEEWRKRRSDHMTYSTPSSTELAKFLLEIRKDESVLAELRRIAQDRALADVMSTDPMGVPPTALLGRSAMFEATPPASAHRTGPPPSAKSRASSTSQPSPARSRRPTPPVSLHDPGLYEVLS